MKFFWIFFLAFICANNTFADSFNNKDIPAATPTLILNATPVAAQVLLVAGGDIAMDKPLFPTFYFWRRVYRLKGKSYFKPCRLTTNGTIQSASGDELDADGMMQINMKRATSVPEYDLDIESVSPTGSWAIGPNQYNDPEMILANNETGAIWRVKMPSFDGESFESDEDWWHFLFWDPNRDLAFIAVSGGPSNGRNWNYYSFDPEKKTLTHIGDGINFDLTPDKQWVLWVEGCWMDYVDRQLHFYKLDTRKDYVLTSGHSDNKFDRWGAQEIDQNGELEKFIKAGKDYYLKGKFFPAIRKYQEAVQVDSKNSEAYGLMGYSFYRVHQIGQAIRALSTSIQFDPGNDMSRYNLALADWAAGDAASAISDLKILYGMDPGNRAKVEADTQFRQIIHSPAYQTTFGQE